MNTCYNFTVFCLLLFSAFFASGYDSNVIAERSLIMQVYGIIHQAGPSGFTLTVRFTLFIFSTKLMYVRILITTKHLILTAMSESLQASFCWCTSCCQKLEKKEFNPGGSSRCIKTKSCMVSDKVASCRKVYCAISCTFTLHGTQIACCVE